jgi:hypothetical protein
MVDVLSVTIRTWWGDGSHGDDGNVPSAYLRIVCLLGSPKVALLLAFTHHRAQVNRKLSEESARTLYDGNV